MISCESRFAGDQKIVHSSDADSPGQAIARTVILPAAINDMAVVRNPDNTALNRILIYHAQAWKEMKFAF